MCHLPAQLLRKDIQLGLCHLDTQTLFFSGKLRGVQREGSYVCIRQQRVTHAKEVV